MSVYGIVIRKEKKDIMTTGKKNHEHDDCFYKKK